MPVINILAPHVADMIAAGEVVERPASVIKELMENCFDAGAKNVIVEIRGGGATYIRVTDDGCGMSPEDAGIAFLRHATSKLKDEKGLEAIGTMGFRGEALAAISAVSRVELVTRTRDSNAGTAVTLTAGEIDDMNPTGCPVGTTMIVRDLFFNTPARFKFLKSDRSEAAACRLAALRCALARPEVSVRFLRDGQEEFFSPGDGRAESCVYSLLGSEAAATLLPCSGSDAGASVSGFVSSPSAGRGNRAGQYFFVNGRFIRSQTLQTAVEQAYRNSLLSGRYPSCVLYLSISPGAVDVNVHPAKIEVKFSDEKKIFDLVYYAALSTLKGEDRTSSAPKTAAGSVLASDPRRETAKMNPDFYKTMSAAEYRSSLTPSGTLSSAPRSGSARAGGSGPVRPASSGASRASSAPTLPGSYSVPEQTRLDLTPSPAEPRSKSPAPAPVKAPVSAPAAAADHKMSVAVENPVQNVETQPIPDHKIVGEAMKTYILVEVGEELILIDKHAAHERMIFDRLKQQDRSVMAQELLLPVTVRLTAEDAEAVSHSGELLSGLGFEIDLFGDTDVMVRAVPADMDPGDVPGAVEEICGKLRSGSAPDPQSARDEVLHTVACKAAIKAGWNTTPQELERIAVEVLSGRVKYCPHGRPVSIVVTRNDLDKLFKRIV